MTVAEVLVEYSQLQMLTSSSVVDCLVLSFLNLLMSIVLPVVFPPTIIKLTTRYDTELQNDNLTKWLTIIVFHLLILDFRYERSRVGELW